MYNVERIWYKKSLLSFLLLPLSYLYSIITHLRRRAYKLSILKAYRLPVPIVIIGNITVGGTGKTPLVIAVAQLLRSAGYHPGVISRGYKGKSKIWPLPVSGQSDPYLVGDEPVLVARRAQCPVWVGPDRVEAARQLLQHSHCDVIISDDGMQHYRLQRDIEIAVVDGKRRLGNGRLLPAGPLRESPGRLENVDLIVVNGAEPQLGEYDMKLRTKGLYNLLVPNERLRLDKFPAQRVHAVAGIGHPERFFDTLKKSGFDVIHHQFADHHYYHKEELEFGDGVPVIMTEKDAVKINFTLDGQYWYLTIDAQLNKMFEKKLLTLLKSLNHSKEAREHG